MNSYRYKTLFFFLLSFLFQFFSPAQNKPSIDSLEALLKKDIPDTQKVFLLNRVAEEYQDNKFESAIDYAKKALALSEEIDYIHGKGLSYYIMGNTYITYNFYPEAIKCLNEALVLFEKNNDQKWSATTYNSFGMLYWNKSDYTDALNYFIRAIKIFERTNSTEPVYAATLNNIGNIYYDLDNYNLALYYYNKSLDVGEKSGNLKIITSTLSNIGNIYLSKDQFGKTKEYYDRALAIYEDINDQRGMATIYGNLSELFTMQNDYFEAIKYNQKAILINEIIGDRLGLVYSLIPGGKILSAQGKYSSANDYYTKALSISNEISSKKTTRDIYKLMAQNYESAGDIHSAYNQYKLYAEIKDSLFTEEKNQQIAEIQTKYETEKKEQQIEQQYSTIKKRNFQILAIASILLLLFIIAALIIYQLRIQSKKRASELQQKLLRTQMNPHFLFNALTSIQGMVLEKTPDEAADYISKFAFLMRHILENGARGYIPLNNEIKFLQNYLELQQLRYDNVFAFSISVLPLLTTTASVEKKVQSPLENISMNLTGCEGILIPPMLAQPFIENAIEHGTSDQCEKGFIEVKFEIYKKNIVFSVENWCTKKINRDIHGETRPVSLRKLKSEYHHNPMSFTITKERLFYLNKGQRKKIEIDFTDGKKTKVSFKIPIISNE